MSRCWKPASRRVGEFHYLHHDRDGKPYANIAEMAERIAAAAGATGISLTLLPVFYAHSGFGGAAPNEGQRRFINDPERFARLLDESRRAVAALDGAVVGVAPHSLRAVTPDELRAVTALAGDGPIHIHVAEQMKEVEDCIAWSGARPVEWLLANADVDRRWCLIHATHMTDAETDGFAAQRRGRRPLPDHRGQSRRRHLCRRPLPRRRRPLRHRLGFQRADRRRRRVAAARIFAAPGAPRAQRARQGQRLDRARGCSTRRCAAARRRLAPGLPASRQATPPTSFRSTPAIRRLPAKRGDAILDAWIFANGATVDCVWARGRKLVEGGRHHPRDADRQRPFAPS